MKRIKLIMAGPYPPPDNGMSLAFKMLFDGLGRSGEFDPHLVNLASKDSTRRDEGFTFGRLAEVAGILFSFIRAVVRVRPALVYITISQSKLGFLKDALMINLARLAGAAVVVHLHGGNFKGLYLRLSPLSRSMVKRTLARCRFFIVLSRDLAGNFDFVPRWEAGIRIVPNSLPTAVSSHGLEAKVISRPFNLLFLSPMMLEKGYLDVLEAIAILKQRGYSWVQAYFAGNFLLAHDHYVDPAEMQAEFQSKIAAWGLSDQARYVGFVSGRDKMALFENNHLFILPTYHVNEGQPLSIIEAMAMGLPVITTNYRGITALIKDGENGFFVPPRSPAAIADQVVQLLNHPDRYTQISRRNIQAAASDFSSATHILRIKEIFLECLQPGPSEAEISNENTRQKPIRRE
ncbi:MAG: glycosyltransferase family 4 protein [Deltaproteobacteria bacterium]|nr:glycosyltransferase family 4 protein [Deltaproteobacteria bacterium]MBF0525991.1 glycosyltransferase family 4 protein [Deltaproteobacteria bacterium]